MTSSPCPRPALAGLLAAALLALVAGLAGCGSSPSDDGSPASAGTTRPADRGGEPARVVGTVLDAATRTPLDGAVVRGPGGREARTDAAGRFELAGLTAGTAGELVATAADGRTATLRLRPLAPGRLEVVLHVRPAPEVRH